MDIEFHYYVTFVVALRAGLTKDEAYILAYSSQHVDDNTKVFKIRQGGEDIYSNYISQTSNILKAEKELMQIYPIFHFMPGDKDEIQSDGALRRDGKFHVLNTIPDNSNARVVLKAAFDEKNLYRIGIATHMFADTFAHQNFVGYYESFNAMKGLLDKAIPDVGHADAKHDPDLPGLIWGDMRLIRKNTQISNKERFLEAAGRLFEEYRRYKDPKCAPEVIEKEKAVLLLDIDAAIGDVGDHDINNREQKNRMARYKNLLGNTFKEYDKGEWFEAAVARKGILAPFKLWATYEWKPDYQGKPWFKFQEAVKNHQWFTKDNVLNQITANLELERFHT
jgi:hypothetical protein